MGEKTDLDCSYECSSISNQDGNMYSVYSYNIWYLHYASGTKLTEHNAAYVNLKQQASNSESFSLHSQNLLEQSWVDAILQITLTAMERYLQSGREGYLKDVKWN